MYPKISDFLNDLFGTNICLPVQSYGFFLALAFLAAFLVIRRELRRQTAAGIFPSWKTELTTGGPLPLNDVWVNALLMAFIGYKLFLMLEDYNTWCENPQGLILSAEGSIPGALLFGGAMAAYRYWIYRKRKEQKAIRQSVERSVADELGTIFTIAFVAGVLGAKVFHNIEYWEDFLADPVGQFVSFSGLTFYGGLLVAAACILWYMRRRGYQLLPFMDSASIVLMLGYGIGRMGCHISGDGDWGIINNAAKPGWLGWAPDWFWSYTYPNNVLNRCNPDPERYTDIVCKFSETPFLVQPVFPTPLYESIACIALFGLLMLLRKRLPFWGQLSGIYLIINGMERFLIESIRVNAQMDLLGMKVTQAQLISTLLFLTGVTVFTLATFVWRKNLSNTPIKPVQAPRASGK